MTFGLPPVRLVADFRALAMGIKPKSPGSVATVSWPSGDSRFGGIGWYGGGITTKRMKRAKRWNLEIDETYGKKRRRRA